MATPPATKAIKNALLAALRAHAWPDALKPIVFRKGPQLALKLAGTEKCVVIVASENLGEGEQSAGSGNAWWTTPALKVVLLVPDDQTETSEDLRDDLYDEFCAFLHDQRTLLDTVKVCHVAAGTWRIGQLFEDTHQVFRAVDLTVSYRTLRS